MYIIQFPEQKLDNSMGDVRFCSLLFHFLQARTSPVPSFSARTRHVRTHPHPCPDSAHGIPKKSCVVAAPPGMKPQEIRSCSLSLWQFQTKFTHYSLWVAYL